MEKPKNPAFNVKYMRETGLICIEQYNTGVELTLEDLDELMSFALWVGRDKIASREDFK